MHALRLRQRAEYDAAGRREGTRLGRQQRALSPLATAADVDTPPAEGVVVMTVGERSVTWSGAPPTAALAARVGALAKL